MALVRHRLPTEHRRERRLAEAGRIVEAPKQFYVRDNISDLEGAKVMVRHEFEMGLDFVCVVATETHLHQSFASLTRRLGPFVKRMPVGEVLCGGVVQLP